MANPYLKAQLAARRLLHLADQSEPRVEKQIERALRQLQTAIDVDLLANVLASGDYFAMSQLYAALPKRMDPAVETLKRLFMKASKEEVGKLNRAGVGISFNAVDPFMVEAARRNAARLVVDVSAQTQAAIRTVIVSSFEDGIAPRQAAKLIRGLVGLTERQAESVYRYRQSLIAEGMSPVEATSRALARAERLIQLRARTIARTETIAAATAGQLASWRSAMNRGMLPNDAKKVWITTPDDRLCRFCARMNGQKALLFSTFESSEGPLDGPPLHPNCRCAIALQFASMRVAA